MIKRFFRWLLNKDELDRIGNELQMIRVLISSSLPKQNAPLAPLAPLGQKKC